VQVQVADLGGLGEEVWVGAAGQPAAYPVGLKVQIGQDPSDL
jgi:hypothetical protein